MARTKEFDPNKALHQAVELFWTQGYARTSLDDLMEAMSIARQSLYDTFGDKHQLYLRALARYREDTLAATRAHFESEPETKSETKPTAKPVKEAFRTLLSGIAEQSKTQLKRGCLLLNAGIERDPSDEKLAELLLDHQKALESIFQQAIERAQASGEVNRKKDPAALARFFVATQQGMHAFGRIQPKRKQLESIAETALAAL